MTMSQNLFSPSSIDGVVVGKVVISDVKVDKPVTEMNMFIFFLFHQFMWFPLIVLFRISHIRKRKAAVSILK